MVAGLGRDGEPIYIDLAFLDGRRGAHVNVSGISGIATKTTYATFLLHALFRSNVLGGEAANTKALIFNVKGEDLLFLDKANRRLTEDGKAEYEALGFPPSRSTQSDSGRPSSAAAGPRCRIPAADRKV